MSTLRIPLTRNVVGLRLHAEGVPGVHAPRAKWLLSLRDREKQRRADAMALQAFAVSATDALEAMPGVVNSRIDEIAGIAVELGLAVAREIVGDALDAGFVDPTPTVVRCLRDCVHGSSGEDLVIHVNPEDLATIERTLDAMPELREEVGRARLVADASVGRGAVRAETETGRLRYDPREALERVSDEVRREVTA